jgi:hypothetical protein
VKKSKWTPTKEWQLIKSSNLPLKIWSLSFLNTTLWLLGRGKWRLWRKRPKEKKVHSMRICFRKTHISIKKSGSLIKHK